MEKVLLTYDIERGDFYQLEKRNLLDEKSIYGVLLPKNHFPKISELETLGGDPIPLRYESRHLFSKQEQDCFFDVAELLSLNTEDLSLASFSWSDSVNIQFKTEKVLSKEELLNAAERLHHYGLEHVAGCELKDALSDLESQMEENLEV